MYCPQCGAEYREGFQECSDCGVPLTPEAPVRTAERDEPLEEVLRIADAALLPVIKSVLSAEGIPFSIQGEEATALLPVGTARQLRGILRVPKHLAGEARQLIEQLPVPVEGDSEPDGDET